MASLSFTLNHLHTATNYYKTNSFPILTHTTTKLKFPNSTFTINLPIPHPSIRNSNSAKIVRRNSSISEPLNEAPDHSSHEREETLSILKRWIKFVQAVLLGGSWWNLPDFNRGIGVKPMTVFEALSRMWALISDKKWIMYTAFGALTVAAVRVTIYVAF
ncbi:hypothetical protein RD792_004280 [Penstemon davidsonii]|uniref:Uncharacterized protein n=1 Tax=Penstemon davidsonii TaxID=160366 RepID=A0ABR0DI51_9LAMI|nr:hypothetical protein RD792_004280 [Penstemon davidsonii]